MKTMNTETNTVPTKAKLALIGACFFWAASFIATKTALDNVPPLTVVMLRLAISSLCFLAWMAISKRKIPFKGLKWLGRMFLLSLFGTGLHYGIQTIGLQYTTASNASLYAVTGPISITIIAALFLGERITFKKVIGIAFAMLGVIVVMGWETIAAFDLKGHLLGDLLVFTSIFMWGVFTVLGKDTIRSMNAIDMTAVVTFIGTLYMIPIGLWEMNKHNFSMMTIPTNAWASLAFLGITCSFLATLLYMMALQQTESQKVGVYLYTIPPMTYVIAALVLKESITLSLLLGSLIVLAGVYITEKG
jgi:drug/metabolite transporter (DMT)-like permease